MFRQLRNNLQEVRFKMLLSGLFTTNLIYRMTDWGTVWGAGGRCQEIPHNSISLRKEDMRKLQVLQNSSLRFLLGAKYDTPPPFQPFETIQISKCKPNSSDEHANPSLENKKFHQPISL